MDIDGKRQVFTSPWADSYVKGGKQLRFSQADGQPDAFVGYGENRTEPPSGTWFDLMRAAYNVLASRNTLRVASETRAPGRLHLPGGVPDAFDYFEQPYRRDNRPYRIDEDDLWPERRIHIAPNFRISLVPGTDDEWVTVRGDEDTPFRPEVTWWELMRISGLILSSPNTRKVFEWLKRDLPSTARRRLPLDREDMAQAVTPEFLPYQFEAGVDANVNPRGAFDF